MPTVRRWADVVRRIRSYQKSTNESPVNLFLEGKQLIKLSSTLILSRLRTAVTILGKDSLGVTADDIGLHSLRSGAAMSMYLTGTPVYVIMLIGRWSSDAFLRYIRRQVQEFSTGVSSNMIKAEHFFTIPEANVEDPRSTGHRHNLQLRQNFGRNAASNSAIAPQFALWT